MSIARDESGDAALWHRAAAGDHEAFGQLFDRHADAVYGYLMRRTADWSQAEDLTAAVFFQAWRRRGHIVLAHDSALPWLLGVARQLLRNARRADQRYRRALDRIGVEAMRSAPPDDPAESVAGRVDSERAMAALRAAIAVLPPHQREAIELCVWSGLDQQAAAVALGVSVGTVKSRLHRARQRLAADLRHAPADRPAPGMETP